MRGEAEPDAPPETVLLGVEPATEERSDGWPYLISARPDFRAGRWSAAPCHRHPRLADARLMAAALELSAVLLRLLTSPALMRGDLDPNTRTAVDAAWALFVRVAPHLEIGA